MLENKKVTEMTLDMWFAGVSDLINLFFSSCVVLISMEPVTEKY